MASVTAEVLLALGASRTDIQLVQSIDTLRFQFDMGSQEIVQILSPVWRAGYDRGFDDGYDQCNDGG